MADKNPLIKSHKFSVFSLKYKNNITEKSIRKAFEHDIGSEENYPDVSWPAWRSPPIRRRFKISSFFSLYNVRLRRAAPLLHENLRIKYWDIDEDEYQECFLHILKPAVGLGFSGSLFYYTFDKSYIVKSIGRKFEYNFLYTEFLEQQARYFQETEKTLIAKIVDVLFCFDRRLGGIFNLSPAHYLVMENLLKDMDPDHGWKKWDLKPQQFFEPVRDLIPDKLKTKAAKTGLADALEDSEDMVYLHQDQKDELFRILDRDTAFLAEAETIDYSLLLGRYPTEGNDVPAQPESFITGVVSSNGKWVYKMCIVDTLWNVNQLAAKLTKAISIMMPEQTITTQPARYRDEFLAMMDRSLVRHIDFQKEDT